MTIKWTIRKEFTISLAPGTLIEDMIAPFNLLNFNLTMIFEDIDIELEQSKELERSSQRHTTSNFKDEQKGELVKFKFNCMKRVGNNTP